MATKIYEDIKHINATGTNNPQRFNNEIRNAVECADTAMPVIAKGNIYQGIVAQW